MAISHIATKTVSASIEYEGMHFGLSISYPFDSTGFKNTLLNSLQYGIKLETGLKIDKWVIRPSLSIPFKSAMGLNLFVGFKVF